MHSKISGFVFWGRWNWNPFPPNSAWHRKGAAHAKPVPRPRPTRPVRPPASEPKAPSAPQKVSSFLAFGIFWNQHHDQIWLAHGTLTSSCEIVCEVSRHSRSRSASHREARGRAARRSPSYGAYRGPEARWLGKVLDLQSLTTQRLDFSNRSGLLSSVWRLPLMLETIGRSTPSLVLYTYYVHIYIYVYTLYIYIYMYTYIYIYVGCLVKWGPWFLDGRPARNDPVCSGCFVACLQPCSGIVGMLACVKCFSLPKWRMSKALGAYTWSRSKVLTHKILQLSWSRGAGVQVQATAPFGASQFNLKMRGSLYVL